jgi:hypothetical protein
MAFPTTGILDSFDRANEGPPPSASWTSGAPLAATSTLAVVSNACQDNGTLNGGIWGTQLGPDVECYMTWSSLPADTSNFHVFIRAADVGSPATIDGYRINFERNDGVPGMRFRIDRMDNGAATQLGTTFSNTDGAISAGVKIGVEMISSSITTYLNRSGSWASQSTESDATYSVAGYLGIRPFNTAVVFDDLGGGSIGGAPPATAVITFVQGARW